MKYHRFRYSFNKWINRKRKWDPVEHEKKVRNIMIYSHHYIIQIRHMELNKYWLGFTIVKAKNEDDKIKMYARRIQK